MEILDRDIEIKETPYGLYLTATISGTGYKSRYKHKNITKALEDFRALIRKYQPKGDLATMGGE
jgi:hypothetical protein